MNIYVNCNACKDGNGTKESPYRTPGHGKTKENPYRTPGHGETRKSPHRPAWAW